MSKVLFTSSDLVRLSDGSVDLDASLAKFEGTLSNHIASVELETVEIANAVSAAFDKFPGARLGMTYVINQALQILNVQPENHKTLEGRVHVYIQENADQDAVYATDPKTGKVIGKGDERVMVTEPEADRTRMFGIGKGKGGGVVRWSDVPEKPAAK